MNGEAVNTADLACVLESLDDANFVELCAYVGINRLQLGGLMSELNFEQRV